MAKGIDLKWFLKDSEKMSLFQSTSTTIERHHFLVSSPQILKIQEYKY